jgi:hypothetical protein
VRRGEKLAHVIAIEMKPATYSPSFPLCVKLLAILRAAAVARGFPILRVEMKPGATVR